MTDNKTYTIQVRLWVQETEGPFLGIGKFGYLKTLRKRDQLPMLLKK